MKENVGVFDRIVRLIAGLVILTLGFVFKSWWGLVGLVPLMTAFMGCCALYTVFGFSTCRLKGKT